MVGDLRRAAGLGQVPHQHVHRAGPTPLIGGRIHRVVDLVTVVHRHIDILVAAVPRVERALMNPVRAAVAVDMHPNGVGVAAIIIALHSQGDGLVDAGDRLGRAKPDRRIVGHRVLIDEVIKGVGRIVRHIVIVVGVDRDVDVLLAQGRRRAAVALRLVPDGYIPAPRLRAAIGCDMGEIFDAIAILDRDVTIAPVVRIGASNVEIAAVDHRARIIEHLIIDIGGVQIAVVAVALDAKHDRLVDPGDQTFRLTPHVGLIGVDRDVAEAQRVWIDVALHQDLEGIRHPADRQRGGLTRPGRTRRLHLNLDGLTRRDRAVRRHPGATVNPVLAAHHRHRHGNRDACDDRGSGTGPSSRHSRNRPTQIEGDRRDRRAV